MSGGRRVRRQLRVTQPAGSVELSAESRRLVRRMLAARVDDSVSLAEFLEIARELHDHAARLPEPQRLEVAGQVIGESLGGRYIGWRKL